jgi:hypothetical protein
MSEVGTGAGSAFERWAWLVLRNRWAAIALVLVAAGAAISQIPHLRTSTAVEAFLHDDDPALLLYDSFRHQFGRDQVIVLAVESPDLFSPDFVDRLRAVHRALEAEVPHLEEVTSLINARVTRSDGDELIVEDLLAIPPEGLASWAKLRQRVFANPLYIDTLISSDARLTTLTIKPSTYSSGSSQADSLPSDTDTPLFAEAEEASAWPDFLSEREGEEHVSAVEDVVARFDDDDFQIHMAGGIAMGVVISRAVQSDIGVFMALAGALVVIGLYLAFRSLWGVVLPFVVVGLSLGATMGIMALLEIPLSITTEILPPFMLTMGVCDSVHILVIRDRLLASGATRDESIARAIGHSGSAVVMTSLTTAGGLVSFAVASVAPIAHLGVVAPIGVMIALVLTLTLLPALLAVIPGSAGARAEVGRDLVSSCLSACAEVSVRHPVFVVSVCGVLAAVALAGATRLRFSQDELQWFPENEPLRVDTALIDRELRGAMSLELLLETPSQDGLQDPELLRAIDDLTIASQRFDHGGFFIGKTISLADLVKEIHQALSGGQIEARRIPPSREAVAQELLLFEGTGSDDLESLTDSRYQLARINLRIPWADSALYPELIAAIEGHVAPFLADRGELRLTGLSPLMGSIFAAAIETLWRSYALALLVIIPLMVLMLRSIGLGLLSMIPNLFPILLTLGLMGWLELPLDMSNLLIGGIVLGIAVDDTIHFFHRFGVYRRETGDSAEAIRLSLQTTGRALFYTSMVLAAGFGVLAFAYMRNISAFGLLAGGAVALAFIADVLLSPALLMLSHDKAPARSSGR